MTDPQAEVGPAARAIGFAGLLPQAAAAGVLGLVIATRGDPALAVAAAMVACVYAALILSFLGGLWWSMAMRRTEGQGRLAMISVLPSLVAGALLLWALLGRDPVVPMVLLGLAIIATLLVDARMAAAGEAPAGWMRLRRPLSLGLGTLTILAALLVSG